MFAGRARGFGIGLGRGVEIHVVAQQAPQRYRVRVIMMGAVAGLVRLARVERDAFVNPRVTIPIARPADFAGTVPVESIPRITSRRHPRNTQSDPNRSAFCSPARWGCGECDKAWPNSSAGSE